MTIIGVLTDMFMIFKCRLRIVVKMAVSNRYSGA